jgi:UDP-N-acetylglucosamine:LPS N-acetylglucosamine transferase
MLFALVNSENKVINIRKLLIAGGGTGGHLFPGIAIAQEFMSTNLQNTVLFVSTGNDFEKSALSHAGFRLQEITAGGVKGLGRWRQAVSKVWGAGGRSSRCSRFKKESWVRCAYLRLTNRTWF